MNRQFWRGKRVLITGHTGFKGSWLSLWLHLAGAQVSGYALAPRTEPSLFAAAGLVDDVTHSEADVRDLARLTQVVAAAQPEIVFHLAAQPLVRLSYVLPVETYAVNVMGTAHLLEAIRGTPSVRAVVVVTSDKCYENREWIWSYREIDPMGGRDPYSSSKGCAELVTAAYRESFFQSDTTAAIASARAGNVIGGGDWAEDRLVPDMMRAFVRGNAARIRLPTAVRPWQHVLEPLAGYVVLAERLLESRSMASAWNFGPSLEASQPVSSIVDRICSLWGDGARWELDGHRVEHEARSLRLESTKAHALLGWRTRLLLDEALDWTVSWYRRFYVEPSHARSLMIEQIERYEALSR
jgi:CDP-glucose 4,6-dehydratase